MHRMKEQIGIVEKKGGRSKRDILLGPKDAGGLGTQKQPGEFRGQTRKPW